MRLRIPAFLAGSAIVSFAFTQGAGAASQATLHRLPEGIKLIVDRTEAYPVGFEANSISWSKDGQWIAVHQKPSGPLYLWSKSSRELKHLADAAVGPVWAGSGAHLLYSVADKGLFAWFPGSEAKTIAKDSLPGSAAWSPDGDRIAFSTKAGIFTVNADGSNRRRLLKNQHAKALAWRPSDGSITFVNPGLKGVGSQLMSLQSGVPGAKRLLTLDAEELSWSPSGALLLAKSEAKWIIYDPVTGRISRIAEAVGTPTWQGSRKLRYSTGKGIATGLGEFGPIEPFPPGASETCIAWAAVPTVEFSNDMIFKSPFEGAALPAMGEIRVEGYIDSADPLKGECSIVIQRIIDSTGKQVQLARGISQTISIPDTAVRFDGKESSPFRPIDLRSDVDVSMVLLGDKPAADTPLAAREVWLATPIATPAIALSSAPRLTSGVVDYDGVSHEEIIVPLTFPVLENYRWSDTFLADRGGGTRRHHGQDIMAPKMTPVVACFDGVVIVGRAKRPGGHNTLTIRGDNGWIANYYHLNNDTPGTDDGLATDEHIYAPGLESGQRVAAGQFLGYVGDSGNAEGTAPHLHFELWDSVTKAVVNATPSLKAATASAGAKSAVAAPANVKMKPKEVRYDGIVRDVDVKRSVIRISLLSQTLAGKAKPVTRAKSVYVKLANETDAYVLGNENVPVNCEDLRPGLYAVVVGMPVKGDAALTPRVAAFAPRD